MRAILAGGGTGGHVIPALAIAHELRARYGAEVAFVGTQRGIETRLVPQAGYPLKLIEVGALKNVSLATRLKTLFALPLAIVRSWEILQEFRPDVVIGVGGYASGPAMLAASLSSIPTVAFEPNVVPGLANRAVAPLVTTAVVHFEETGAYFRRFTVTGVPVRHAFFELPPRAAEAPPVLLVFGGSQGAAAINRVVIESLAEFAARVPGLHVIHQTGERDYNPAQAAYLHAPLAAEVSPFIDDMPAAFARADLVVCRSGASTVAEITAAGKPAIFVPFPRAADDHQRRNAEALASRGAALLIPEPELTRERLVAAVTG
ncbi:MAG TPA: undecaprenyldiphospho-muramoylpentapeptide beta-N-acetylglucosaminyltransferase, partial [Terriglobales bacterium]|nr:undecaprenyldiphospho-muramoylpentapeptide beta-N-acetylglucosaminyltransferase [Terriglobales bacterium]